MYNAHGDVIALVDATGTAVASYTYDPWGVVTVNTESFANGWHNPYLYDGKDGVRYDAETGLYWMSVRAYDPTLGRFIARDPLGRAPLMGWTTQPYAYAGNNPLLNVDPSGQRFATENGAQAQAAASFQRKVAARVYRAHLLRLKHPTGDEIRKARAIARSASSEFTEIGVIATALVGIVLLAAAACAVIVAQAATNPLDWLPAVNFGRLAFALGLFGAQLGALAGESFLLAWRFDTEAGEPDSWWSVQNVLDFGLKLGGIIAAFSGFEALLGIVVKAYAAVGNGIFGAIALVGQALVSFFGLGVTAVFMERERVRCIRHGGTSRAHPRA